MKHRKKYQAVAKALPSKKVGVEEALKFIQDKSFEKFDPTIELHVRLGIDPKQSDQIVRGSVALPAGTGKNVKVTAIVSDAKQKEAKEAGADKVAGLDLIEQIKKGKIDFDVLIATPDMMPKLWQVAKILGPKGLMPNPKTETVGADVGKMIKAVKSGKANFKNDEYGIVHLAVGKKSFKLEDLVKNVESALEALKNAKPESIKGTFFKTVSISSSMSPSLRLNVK